MEKRWGKRGAVRHPKKEGAERHKVPKKKTEKKSQKKRAAVPQPSRHHKNKGPKINKKRVSSRVLR